jgi:Cu-Zn family superoxide dismutase
MRSFALIILLGLISGTGGCYRRGVLFAVAHLMDPEGKPVGEAALIQEEGEVGVRIFMKGWGLPPGVHGFHIHEAPFCDPPTFESAGGHFNPYGNKHGLKDADGPHAGDLPNLTVLEDGKVEVTIRAPQVTLGRGKNSLLRSVLEPGGTSLVLHARADDEGTDLRGSPGDRIACGTIRKFDGRPLEDRRQ